MWYDKYTKKLTHAEYPSRFDLEALIVSYMVATIFIGDVQHWTTSFLAKFTQFVGVKIWKFWVTSLYQCVGTIPVNEKGFLLENVVGSLIFCNKWNFPFWKETNSKWQKWAEERNIGVFLKFEIFCTVI